MDLDESWDDSGRHWKPVPAPLTLQSLPSFR